MQIAINHDPTDPTENRCHRFLAALHDVNYNVVGVVADDGGAAGGGVLTERYAYSPYGQRQVFGHVWHFADLNGDGRVDSLDLDIFDHEYYGSLGDAAQPGDLDADGDADLDDRNRLSNALGWNHDHDPHLLTPRTRSARVEAASGAGGVQQPYGLCRIGHQGLAHDEETGSGGGGGLIHNRARTRSPQLGRFLQRDPLGYVDGMNVYAGYHILSGHLDPTGMALRPTTDIQDLQRIRKRFEHLQRYGSGTKSAPFKSPLMMKLRNDEVLKMVLPLAERIHNVQQTRSCKPWSCRLETSHIQLTRNNFNRKVLGPIERDPWGDRSMSLHFGFHPVAIMRKGWNVFWDKEVIEQW